MQGIWRKGDTNFGAASTGQWLGGTLCSRGETSSENSTVAQVVGSIEMAIMFACMFGWA